MPAIALLFALAGSGSAALAPAASPAMQQLTDLEGTHPDQAPTPENAAAGGSLGFHVQSLQPIGYMNDQGAPQVPPQMPGEPAPLPPAQPSAPQAPAANQPQPGKTYVFEGTSKIPGVTIYTPKEDTTGNGQTQKPPREGLGGGLLMYGGIAAAAAAALIFTSINPFIIIGLAIAAVAAGLFFFNRKTA